MLDAGSGTGASAVHLAERFGCEVVGITVEPEGVAAGSRRARERGVSERTSFVQGDPNHVDPLVGLFDIVVVECVLSIQAHKDLTLDRVRSVLNPGGRLAMTDVTADPHALPDSLHDLFATAGCLNGALPLQQYEDLASGAGFTVELAEDLPETASRFVRDLRGRLLLAEAAATLGKLPESVRDLVGTGKQTLAQVDALVRRGALGYGLLIARR